MRWVVTMILLAGCATGENVTDLSKGTTGWLAYPSSLESVTLRARLELPEKAEGRVPAVIIVHGSGGLGGREARWTRFFTDNGMAAFMIDYFGPRSITSQSAFQPTPHHDVEDALRLLSTHPRIDPARIGIIGFSRGAVMAVNAANASGFAAHVGLYPACDVVSVRDRRSKAPVLILVGQLDEAVRVSGCELLAQDAKEAGRIVELRIYDNAHHGWDGDYTGSWYHRAINKSYRVQADELLTQRSQEDVLRFFRAAFNIPR